MPDHGERHQQVENGRGGVPGPTPLAQRLFQARMDVGLSRTAAAVRAGIADNTIYRYEAGRNVPRPECIARLARAYGTSVGRLYGEPVAKAGPDCLTPADPAGEQQTGRGMIGLPVITTVAGSGSMTYDESPRCFFPYRQDWLATHGANPRDCRLVEVMGDSMKPVIPPRSLALVDTAHHNFWDGSLYLMTAANEGVVVRRVFQDGSTWVVRGDHPDCRPRVCDPSWQIHGRVRGVFSLFC